jgi:dTMP kinase
MLVSIEGIDGSGKGTQTDLLRSAAEESGYRVETFSFPRYGTNPFAEAVSAYLNGQYGSADDVSPYLSALLYAGDRFCARDELMRAEKNTDLVVCDRYIDSNVAHQAAKLSRSETGSFVRWIESIEYRAYAMPRPHLTVFLRIPVPIASTLIRRKAARKYTDRLADIHEADEKYLAACSDAYAMLADRYSDRAVSIDCMDGATLRSPASISAEIWAHVSQTLPRMNARYYDQPR